MEAERALVLGDRALRSGLVQVHAAVRAEIDLSPPRETDCRGYLSQWSCALEALHPLDQQSRDPHETEPDDKGQRRHITLRHSALPERNSERGTQPPEQADREKPSDLPLQHVANGWTHGGNASALPNWHRREGPRSEAAVTHHWHNRLEFTLTSQLPPVAAKAGLPAFMHGSTRLRDTAH
jgi:hypothetical protein